MTRVFDCFTFHDEFELLRGRIALLDDVVDRFVIAEATTTFTGRARPLALTPEVVADLGSKVHVVVVSDAPSGDPWGREHHQRNALAAGLRDLDVDADDLVLVSDIDEVPDPRVVTSLKAHPPTAPVALGMKWFNYCLNLIVDQQWSSGRASRWANVGDPQQLRVAEHLGICENAGWHLSYLGGAERAKQKLADFSHQELAGLYDSEVHLDRCVRHHVDVLGRYVLRVIGHDEVPAVVCAEFAQRPEVWARPARRRDLLVARAYCLTTRERSRIGPDRCDRHPVLSFVAALGIVGQRRLRNPLGRPR
jgi:beta-1,4-mannosyl-glycoprotein beta-1,4-N-acetylglucosaminyltransferase